jgi:hypothetical protein
MRDTFENIGKLIAGCCLIVAAGCGGGGGSSATSTSSTTSTSSASSTTATISYYISSTSISRLVGLQFNAYLPAGISVDTDTNTKNVKIANLVAGSALSGQTILGTYSSPILKVIIAPKDSTTLQNGFATGEILKVICTPTTVTGFTLETFKAVNNSNPIPMNSLVGFAYNLSAQKEENISVSLTPSISVAFTTYSSNKK